MQRPIGVFDSGVGGLTVLRELRRQLPGEDFIYLGDTARLPYGTKSAETVARYSVRAAEALLELGVQGIVVACNTASSVGLPAIRERLGNEFLIGVLGPGAEAACAASAGGRIAVIATEGTVRGGAYERAIHAIRPAARIDALACPLFVALAEEGLCEGAIAEGVARHYLEALFRASPARPDTLLLGCTHFPVLLGAISAAIGAGVTLIDSAATTARATREQLAAAGLLSRAQAGTTRFLATDSPERFARVGARFLGVELDAREVELIDL